MHRILSLIALIVAGCTPITGEPDPVAGRVHARFPQYPVNLFAALHATCSEPADTFVQLDPDFAQCRSLLPPESTAAAILQYNGTLDDLPVLVVQLSGQQETDGYILENRYYLHVPQLRGGPALQVRNKDWWIERQMKALLRAAGGIPY